MSVPRPSFSVVITTYEWPGALDVVLRALSEQSGPPFEVVIADDGSGPETARVVERWQESALFTLQHVRQENDGWRKSRILDLGALAASADYLVFLDGDCLVRRGFVESVLRAARPGTFLAGKRLHLGEELSRHVLDGTEHVWRWSTARWLLRAPRELFTSHREVGSPTVLVPLRDRSWPWRKKRDFVPPFDGYGFFFGVSRADFERVNGFDLRFTGWGGEDEDIAERLRQARPRLRMARAESDAHPSLASGEEGNDALERASRGGDEGCDAGRGARRAARARSRGRRAGDAGLGLDDEREGLLRLHAERVRHLQGDAIGARLLRLADEGAGELRELDAGAAACRGEASTSRVPRRPSS